MMTRAGGRIGRRADFEATMRALRELDPLERTVLILVYWRFRTQAQVAAELKLPVAAVRRAVADGLQQLAHRLFDAR